MGTGGSGKRAEHAEANARTFPMFVIYLAVIAAGLAASIVAGFAREGTDPAAGDTVARFTAAIEDKDGATACRQLATDTRKKLEDQEREPCDKAILTLQLSGGRVTRVEVAEASAAVELSGGERAFLDKTPTGWRIGAAGCKPKPREPYDCEIES